MALFKFKNKSAAVEKQNKPELSLEESGLVQTSLVFHSSWEVTNQEKYVYMYKHQQLPLLKKNQISIKGLNLIHFQDGFVVGAFLRNTLSKSIRFENVDILILDEKGQALAKKRFDIDSIGEIPSMSCMPWRFIFGNEHKLVETIPEEGWKIAFELKQNRKASHSHRLDLEESWERELAPAQKEKLGKLVAGLPPLGPSEVNFMGLEAQRLENGNLTVTVLIRNGSEQNLQVEQIPLIVEDGSGEVVSRGSFTLDHFKVKANTSKPWTFIFPKELVTKDSLDLSKWKIYTPSHS